MLEMKAFPTVLVYDATKDPAFGYFESSGPYKFRETE